MKKTVDKNLLIAFSDFDCCKFFRSHSLDEWDVIYSWEFLKKSFVQMIRILRSPRSSFIVARSSARSTPAGFLVRLMFHVARAEKKHLIDEHGMSASLSMSETSITTIQFLGYSFLFPFSHLYNIVRRIVTQIRNDIRLCVRLCYIGIRSCVIFLSAYLIIGILLCIPSQRCNKKRDIRKMLVLRTDYFGTQSVGGSFTHLRGVCFAAKKKGIDVVLAAQGIPADLRSQFRHYCIAYCSQNDFPEIPEILYNYTFFAHVYSIIQNEKPDILYHRHSIFHVSSVLLKWLTKTPLIIEYNGSEAWIRKKWGGRIFFEHLALCCERFLLKHADVVSVVSQVLADQLIDAGVPREKVLMNPNGVDPDQFSPNVDGLEIRHALSISSKTILIGFIGSFGPWHGVEVLAQSIRTVSEKSPNTHFLLIGKGALLPVVESIIRESGTSHCVTHIDSVPHRDIPKYLRACDILTSPHIQNFDGSRFFGSPTKLFEYMAIGRVIVASRLEQISDILEHMRSAILVEPGNASDLTAALLYLTHDAQKRSELSAVARADVVAQYTWDHNIARILTYVEHSVPSHK